MKICNVLSIAFCLVLVFTISAKCQEAKNDSNFIFKMKHYSRLLRQTESFYYEREGDNVCGKIIFERTDRNNDKSMFEKSYNFYLPSKELFNVLDYIDFKDMPNYISDPNQKEGGLKTKTDFNLEYYKENKKVTKKITVENLDSMMNNTENHNIHNLKFLYLYINSLIYSFYYN